MYGSNIFWEPTCGIRKCGVGSSRFGTCRILLLVVYSLRKSGSLSTPEQLQFSKNLLIISFVRSSISGYYYTIPSLLHLSLTMASTAPPFPNEMEQSFARLLDQAPEPHAHVGDRDKEYMNQEDETAYMRASFNAVKQNPEALARTIVDAVGKGLKEGLAKALVHAENPFFEDDDIVTFGGDGSITIEKFPPKQGNEGPSNSNGRSKENVQPKWPQPEGHEALLKINQKRYEGEIYYRIFVVYDGEHKVKTRMQTYSQTASVPFSGTMKAFEKDFKIPSESPLVYYHGPHPMTGEDTLSKLAEDKLIYLDEETDFVMYVYDNESDDSEDNEPLHQNEDASEEADKDDENGEDEEEDWDDKDGYVPPSSSDSEDESPPPPKEAKSASKRGSANSGAHSSYVQGAANSGARSGAANSGARNGAANAGAHSGAGGKASSSTANRKKKAQANGVRKEASVESSTASRTGRRRDTRTARGNRKRKAKSPPASSRNQMDAGVRQQLDGSATSMERAHMMSTPRCFQDGYQSDLSDTSSVAGSKRWPRVVIGQFIYTEQQPNPNGGSETKLFKTPQIHFNAGSKKNRQYFSDKMMKAILGKKEIEFSFHDNYEEFKDAAFGHTSIVQPQNNKVKNRRLKRQQNH